MIAGGAAGALGMLGLEALASTTQAEAATTTVQSVTAGDDSIKVIGTATNPKIETGRLDRIASLHPPAAAVTFNGQKGISVANGSASSDVAAFGQTIAGGNGAPMTGPGDLVYGGTSGAPARLAGDTSGTRVFLREQSSGGVPAAPVWDTLQAADVPQLAAYAPTGLTGATATSRWVGATTSGAPASGTFAAGDFIIDRTGAVWICTTAGSPGTWTQVGATASATQNAGLFGDGSDGSVAFDGTNTFGFASLTGSTYTLTHPVFATSITISSGVTLLTNAWFMMCTGTITNNGTISDNGNNASGGTGGVATTSNAMVAGGEGGSGTETNGQAGSFFGEPFQDAQSGDGGNSGANTGGPGTSGIAYSKRLRVPGVLLYGSMHGVGQEWFAPGIGGGGGAGDGSNPGGGGGGGGGCIAMWTHALVNGGTISATGGNGQNGTGGDAAGGGGGSGGIIVAYTLSAWSNNGTITVAGGAAGNGVGVGGNGIAGGAGVSMNVIIQ